MTDDRAEHLIKTVLTERLTEETAQFIREK